MKRLIIEIAVFVLLIAGVITATAIAVKSSRENQRLKANYENAIKGNNNVQQVLTKSELKALFADELSELRDYGIKPRHVENIIEIQYLYVDSVRYRDTLVWVYDTINYVQGADFDVQTDCHRIQGCIIADTLEISRITSVDNILVSLYRERKKCLFERRKIKAIAISECKGDTLAILRNLKIEK